MDRSRLVYLYVGSADVGRDLGYLDRLGGELVWRVASGGTEMAAVRLGERPLIARVSSMAGPGGGARLIHGPRPGGGFGVEFEVRGVQTLKGVPGEWRLFAVNR